MRVLNVIATMVLLAGPAAADPAPGAPAPAVPPPAAPAPSAPPAMPTIGHPVSQGGVMYMAVPQNQGASAAWQATPAGPPMAIGTVGRGRRGRHGLAALARRGSPAGPDAQPPNPSLAGTQPP